MYDSERSLDPKDEKRLKTRGIGSGSKYEPFIKVHEISSKGESYRIFGRNSLRPHHLLSRLELSAFLIFDRYHLTVDIKEQYPLPIVDTLSICERLGSMRSSLAARLNILKSPMSVSNVAGLSLFYH